MKLALALSSCVLGCTLSSTALGTQFLYATGSASGGHNRFYLIDPTTGAAAPLSPDPGTTFNTTVVGLAFDASGTVYGIAAGQLVQPTFSTYTWWTLGPGLGFSAAGLDIMVDGRAFTYCSGCVPTQSPLYQIEMGGPLAGTAGSVGPGDAMFNALLAAGATRAGEAIVAGMGSVGSTLYAVDNANSAFMAINPDTGAVTIPGGASGQLASGTLANGNLRSRYTGFAALTGHDSNNDGQYDRLLGMVNAFDGTRFGGLVEFNLANGSWELIGTGNPGLNFFALGSPVRSAHCPADLDDGSGNGRPDGGVDINDLLYFLAQYEAGAIPADLDDGSGNGVPDGGVDINDLLFFLTHYEAGC